MLIHNLIGSWRLLAEYFLIWFKPQKLWDVMSSPVARWAIENSTRWTEPIDLFLHLYQQGRQLKHEQYIFFSFEFTCQVGSLNKYIY